MRGILRIQALAPLLPWGVEAVAEAADRLDRRGAVPELPPERSDVRLDHVAPTGVVVAPHVAEEVASLDDRALPLVEIADHLELELRQVDPPAVEHELVLDEVEDRVVLDL